MKQAAKKVSTAAPVAADGALQAREDRAIYRAVQILEGRLREPGAAIRCQADAINLARLNLAAAEVEHFACFFLDNQHCLIAFELLATGTIDRVYVYPREVVKRALFHNAAAVVFAHNHPSGFTRPSTADHFLTARLSNALQAVDVQVLDHLVVGRESAVSFAAQGWQLPTSPEARPLRRRTRRQKEKPKLGGEQAVSEPKAEYGASPIRRAKRKPPPASRIIDSCLEGTLYNAEKVLRFIGCAASDNDSLSRDDGHALYLITGEVADALSWEASRGIG